MPSELIRERRASPRLVAAAAVAIAVVAVLAFGRVPGLDRVHALLGDDAEQVALAVAAQLRAERPELEPIGHSRREVRLLGGRVRLLVRREGSDAPAVAHVHVAAALPGGGPALDACVFGVGQDHREALADAAATYAGVALPPVLAVASAASPGALPFGGTEPWGVPGFRGSVGPLFRRGQIPDTIADALHRGNLFAGAALPEDGRPHLAKVVLLARDRAWERSVEVDGVAAGVSAQAWAGAPLPPGAASVVRFASFRGRDRRDRPGARDEALRRAAAREPGVLARGRCPLPLVPARFGGGGYATDLCVGGRLLDCVEECEAGSASACYHAAQDVQADPVTAPRALALFLDACRLGYASGCTNAAATVGTDPGAMSAADVAACTGPTYDAVCERSGDPWGCAMAGAALLDGRGVPRDPARGRAALEKACRDDERDPACAAARRRLATIPAVAPAAR